MMYVSLDVHKRVCYCTIMTLKEEVVKRGRFSNDPEGLEEFLEGVEEAQVAMEAGYCWQLSTTGWRRPATMSTLPTRRS